MKTLYQLRGYSGNDSSIETSLIEYGVVWKKTKKNEYKFLYATSNLENGKMFFDYGFISKKEWESLCKEEWFKLPEVCDFAGQTENEFMENFPQNIYIAIMYHGIENIFGTSYCENDYIKINE